ncbi:MAG: adenylate cyclase [Haloplasmataceae bacterium]|nr:adenylate cyclase [Haloplasmataceae bacterium]
MAQLLEIEFKNMLTESEYLKLINIYNVNNEKLKKQTNFYFDTKQFELLNKGCTLRVRVKENLFELTLKEKAQVGLLETTDLLDETEFQTLLNSHIIPHKTVFRQLELLNIFDFFEIALLTTYRYEFEYLNQLIALDKSEYYNYTDYEIELETSGYNEGKLIFNNLLKEHSIPVRHAVGKFYRATEYKQKKGY